MPGTLEGGRKAAATNKAKYGADFYANIGRKGGTISKRGPAIRLTADKIKKIREELNEAEQETIKMKIRLLNTELERLMNEDSRRNTI